MKARKVLLDASRLVAEGWEQGSYALDDYSEEVDPARLGASSWCLMGALIWAYEFNGGKVLRGCDWGGIGLNVDDEVVCDITDALVAVILEHDADFENLADWNDDPCRTREEVLQVLTEAASLV